MMEVGAKPPESKITNGTMEKYKDTTFQRSLQKEEGTKIMMLVYQGEDQEAPIFVYSIGISW